MPFSSESCSGSFYYRSGSLVPVILIHMINNAISYFSWALSGERIVSTRQMIGNDTIYIYRVRSGLCCFRGSLDYDRADPVPGQGGAFRRLGRPRGSDRKGESFLV